MPPKRKAAPKANKTAEPVVKKKKTSKSDKANMAPGTSTSGGLELSSLVTDVGWKLALSEEFSKDYFKNIQTKLDDDYKNGTQVFPPRDLIFNAFNLTPINKIRIVILGQDPYHDDGQAMGMAFSVPDGIKPPPSLKNMYKELTNDKGIKKFQTPDHGNLEAWAKRGVFLLNATLTVQAHQPNSHAKYGWQQFTDGVIEVISQRCPAVVFILWGNFAQKKEKLIDSKKHKVIKTAHPSPLSYKKFENCKCFSNANKALTSLGQEVMDWSLQ